MTKIQTRAQKTYASISFISCLYKTLSFHELFLKFSCSRTSGKKTVTCNDYRIILQVYLMLTRPVTSLRHQGWRRVFWESPKFFNYFQ